MNHEDVRPLAESVRALVRRVVAVEAAREGARVRVLARVEAIVARPPTKAHVNCKEQVSTDSFGRFLVVEDNTAYARSLARLLGQWGKVRVTGTVRDAKAALGTEKWAAIFIDLELPDGPGLDVLALARQACPETPVLVLTGCCEPVAINRVSEFGVGVGYAVKPVSAAFLDHFVESVTLAGARYAAFSAFGQLSARERDVLRLALLGLSNKAIASELGLTQSSVGVLFGRIKAKFNVRLRNELLEKAALVDPAVGGGAARNGLW
jgi:DNA-binding NarL/FixJ family response regulator